MKASYFSQYGSVDGLQLKEVATPLPKVDEVLIKVRAATVTTADSEVRRFAFPLWIWIPLRLMFGIFRPRINILGQELAGDIEAVGKNVTNFNKGDAVFAAIEGFGAHAETVCLPAKSAIAHKPDNVSYENAACVTVFGLNALHFVRKAELKPGQKILLNGAGGSIGTIALQLAKQQGAEVTAVDSTEKLDVLKSIGADHVIDFKHEDFTQNGVTYDVILDVVGKSPFSRSLRSLTDSGRYILANPRFLPMMRGLWTNLTRTKKVMFAMVSYRVEDLIFLKDMLAAGTLKPVIDRRFPLAQAADAHRYIDTGKKVGNVILTFEVTD